MASLRAAEVEWKANWDVKTSLTTKGPKETGEPCGERAMVFASHATWWCACPGWVAVSRKQRKVLGCLMFPWGGAVLFLFYRWQTWRQMEVYTKAKCSHWTPKDCAPLSREASLFPQGIGKPKVCQPVVNLPYFHPPQKSNFFKVMQKWLNSTWEQGMSPTSYNFQAGMLATRPSFLTII